MAFLRNKKGEGIGYATWSRMTVVEFLDLGLVDYQSAYETQCEIVEGIASGLKHETVVVLEHPHVLTIGRRGDESNLVQTNGIDGSTLSVVRINRGGDITYHGPGQLVGYPHLDLRRRGRDLHKYLRDLEEVLIRTARRFNVEGFRQKGLTGVWTDEGKLASIGVGVRQWITMHGFALNVSTDLRYFNLINPCGIPECPMTNIERASGAKVPMTDVKAALVRDFEDVFGSGLRP